MTSLLHCLRPEAIFVAEIAVFTVIRARFKTIYEPRTFIPDPSYAVSVCFLLRKIGVQLILPQKTCPAPPHNFSLMAIRNIQIRLR